MALRKAPKPKPMPKKKLLKVQYHEFRIRVSVEGKNREEAWLNLSKLMDKIGFSAMPSYLDPDIVNTCCICGEHYFGFGNNAQPVKKGRCCNMCNDTKVIPARLKSLNN